MRKIWIMAGEASGDIYGAALAEDLRKIGSAVGEEVEIGGMGGPAMAKANVKRTVDSTELGVVGFVEILKHIFTFIGIFRKSVPVSSASPAANPAASPSLIIVRDRRQLDAARQEKPPILPATSKFAVFFASKERYGIP